jgi:hypothetical protein
MISFLPPVNGEKVGTPEQRAGGRLTFEVPFSVVFRLIEK